MVPGTDGSGQARARAHQKTATACARPALLAGGRREVNPQGPDPGTLSEFYVPFASSRTMRTISPSSRSKS